MIKLTRRQEEFINTLFDLYRESGQPIHYSDLAERLGVSRFTAYDMLCLLEEKGYAARAYRLSPDRPGPGRSEIAFTPTEQTHQLIAQLTGPVDAADWEAVKRHALQQFTSGAVQAEDLAEVVLARVPSEEGRPLRYCLETMASLALRLRQARQFHGIRPALTVVLPDPAKGAENELALFGGFALGLLGDQAAADPQWWQELVVHMRLYQAQIHALSPEQRLILAQHIWDTFSAA